MNHPTTPWYRQPLVWMLIAIPATAVIMGIVTIWLAVTTSDGLVVDDYYQQGKQINRVLARDQRAAAMGLRAVVRLSDGELDISLHQTSDAPPPDTVALKLFHATRSGVDQTLIVPAVRSGHYQSPAAVLPDGNWNVELTGADWRLVGRFNPNQNGHITLTPGL